MLFRLYFEKIIQTRAKSILYILQLRLIFFFMELLFIRSQEICLDFFLKQIDLGISIRKLNSIKTLFIILTGNEN